jgi:Lipid A core - O-antigen ligase and related enzymes
MKSLMLGLTALAIVIFFVCLLMSRQPRRTYLLFILYAMPFIDMKITPAQYGSLTVFDGLSYFMLFMNYKDFLSIFKVNRFYFIAFCSLVFLLILGSLTSFFITNSLLSFLSVIPVFIYGRLLILECVQDPEFLRKITGALKLTCLISIGFLAAQMAVGLELRFYSELNQNALDPNGIRYPGYFHDSQKFAQFLAMLSFLFLINWKDAQKPAIKNLLLFLVVIGAMFLTGGRSAFLGLCTGLFFLLLFAGIHYKKYIIAGCLAGGIVIALFSQSFIMFNRQDDFNDSFDFRAAIWRDAFSIYQNHPFLGIGIGNYKDFVSRYSQDQFLILENEIIWLDQPENGYLKILTEFGAPGFFVAFSLILGPMIGAMRAWFKHQTDGRVMLLIAPVCSWLISFISLYSITDRRNLVVLGTLLALLIYSSNRLKLSHESPVDPTYHEPV